MAIVCNGCDALVCRRPPSSDDGDAQQDKTAARWLCLTRPDYDLCERCFWGAPGQDLVVSGHGFLLTTGAVACSLRGADIAAELQRRQQRPREPGGSAHAFSLASMSCLCDGCDEEIVAARFCCTVCLDFDLCHACFAAGHRARAAHDRTHAFVVFWDPPKQLVADLAGAVQACMHVHASPVRRANIDDPATWARLHAVERACFREEAWTIANLKACANPFVNRFVNVVPAPDAPDSIVAYAAFQIKPLSDHATCSSSSSSRESSSDEEEYDDDEFLRRLQQRQRQHNEATAQGRPLGEVCSLTSIAVLPSHQGQSLGSLLLQSVIQQARMRHTCCRVELHVRVTNERAITLYRRHGFVVADVVPRYYAATGEDAFLMALALDTMKP